jgi:hypothetical protein
MRLSSIGQAFVESRQNYGAFSWQHLPDGQISGSPVQPPSQKYSGSLLTQITSISFAIPAHTKGRFAIVTDVGSGCDGRGCATDERVILRTAKSCGPDASMVGVKFLRSKLLGGDGDNKARSPGRARRKPLKPFACGNAGCSGATVVTNARAYYHTTRGCGCNGHPAFPAPSWGSATPLVGRKGSCTNSGASRRGIATSWRHRVPRMLRIAPLSCGVVRC